MPEPLDFEETAQLVSVSPPDDVRLDAILAGARKLGGLSLDDASALLALTDAVQLERMRATALDVKKAVFGDRIVLFAPLYLSNECANTCLYCGFQSTNREERRATLSIDEAVREARHLCERGFRRTLLVAAENPAKCGIDYVCRVAEAIYAGTEMRVVHLNAAPMELEPLRKLRQARIGVFQVFQETYHRPTYERLHVAGKKKDYAYRLGCMERAFEAGFHDVGIGALLGLYDYRFDALATIAHAHHLKNQCGSWPHTISVPRFRPAHGAALAAAPYPVDDITFKKIVAVYRLAVPTAGVVVSTREPAALRDDILHWGASQISAESSTAPGGYTADANGDDASQFSLSDRRPVEDVVKAILTAGMLPSFCASCYHKGREGGTFHRLAAEGGIKPYCDRNAIASFRDYVAVHDDGELVAALDRLIERYPDDVPPGELV